jgi:HK97 family phage major capsid protein
MDLEYARLDGAQLQVKSVDADRRRFSGLATTPDLDRHGHSVDPAGVTYQNPLPLFYEHDRKPIGWATFGAATAAGIPFDAELPTIDEPGALRDRIDEAWQLVKNRLITSVSIGFRILGDAVKPLKGGGLRLLRTEVVELSLVTIPANPNAAILLVKSLTAPGLYPSAAPGGPRNGTAMTLSEQIRTYEATRATKAAAMVAIMAAAAEQGATLDPTERDRYDTLDTEVQNLDEHITRVKRSEQLQLANLAPVPATPAPSRPPVVSVKSNLPPGTAFVRGALALLRANGNRYEAVEIAKQWNDSTPEVALWLKAAVAPGNTTDPAWAGVLAQAANVSAEFVELLRPATILGKIPNLKKVPFNLSVPIQTLGGVYGWTGQGAPKKVTKLGFGTDKLEMTKATGIIVLTEELVRSSNPDAEAICRADMIAGIAQFLDGQFIDPAVAAVAGINPASITNGTTPIVSSGSALADIHALIAALSAANVPLGGVTLIMSETNAFTLGMVRDPQGNRAFPGMGATGGSVDGITVVTSNTAGTNVIALQPAFVLYAESGGVEVDVSREASLQMDDAPVTPATSFTSLWQNNLVGLRAEKFVNWKRAKLEAVKYVSGATYAPAYIQPGGGLLAGGLAGGGSTRGSSAKQA